MACCQVVEQDVLDTDADQFDCEDCPLAAAQDALWPENAEAWTVFIELGQRVVREWGLAGSVWQTVIEGRTRQEAKDLMERIATIYDVMVPAEAPKAD